MDNFYEGNPFARFEAPKRDTNTMLRNPLNLKANWLVEKRKMPGFTPIMQSATKQKRFNF